MIILLAIIGLLAIVAFITCPSERQMKEAMNDNIMQCLQTNDSTRMDHLDNALANVGYMFSKAKPTENSKELARLFVKHNRVEVYKHATYTTMYLFNNYSTEGVRCGLGIFGIVIPLLNYNEFLLRVEPIRKEPQRKTIDMNIEGDSLYFGEIPNLIFKEEEFY
jgi:hypothetical protein